MNSAQTNRSLQWKVGVFTMLGLLVIGAITVLVNDRPFWWRSCQLVHINVEDATGLKTKSPIRSLGIQIGYLKSIYLTESHVRLGICITAPVEVTPATRAYLRGEGFLGDKFVELKPVKYTGPSPKEETTQETRVWDWIIPNAHAEPSPTVVPSPTPAPVAPTTASPATTAPVRSKSKDIPVGANAQDVQQLVNQVNGLVNEMTNLTTGLKEAINPQELRSTMQQLNKTLENASRTLSPEGNLNTTAQRTLAKLEDSIEQLRDLMTRVNKGEGSVGMILNDPVYADMLKDVLKNANVLLSKVADIRFVVDVGGEAIHAYDGTRGWFQLSIWPKPTRYYRLGITVDPRGKRTVTTDTVTSGTLTTTTQNVHIEDGGILVTGMLGKVFAHRLDLSVGVLHGDGTVSAGLWLGPTDSEDRIQIINDVYSRGRGTAINDRLSLVIRPWGSLYLRGGVDSFTKVNGLVPWYYGAGIAFDDEDIKILFALR